jgi:hypothetical protein
MGAEEVVFVDISEAQLLLNLSLKDQRIIESQLQSQLILTQQHNFFDAYPI